MAIFTFTALVDGNVLAAADINTPLSNAANATVPVANGGTGLTSGTSGAIPYFSAATTMASSSALTQYGIVYGGGAGSAPTAMSALTTGQLLVGTSTAPAAISAGTNGQVLIAATGAAPAFASLTAGSNITLTPGANTLTIAASGVSLTGSAVSLTSGDITTTSTTLTDLTGASITLTTGARRCQVNFAVLCQQNTNDSYITYNLDIDGTQYFGTATNDGLSRYHATAGKSTAMAFSFLTPVLTAASHTFKIRWRVNAGTGTTFAGSGGGTSPLTFSVYETPLTS
jgi:hypothetical protein